MATCDALLAYFVLPDRKVCLRVVAFGAEDKLFDEAI